MRALLSIIGVFVVWASVISIATAAPSESDLRTKLCAGMEQEVLLSNGTRVDCLTDRHAIEVDWTHKWAEAIGQALSYSAATDKMPGIILICKVGDCLRHVLLIEETAAHWRLPMTVWLCGVGDSSLAECGRREMGRK